MSSVFGLLGWPFSSTTQLGPHRTTTVNRPDNHESTSLSDKKDQAQEGAESLAKYVSLLEPFGESAGGALPTGARAAPEIAQQSEGGLSWKVWQALPFFTGQGTSLTRAYINHLVYGPPKPSWTISLTIFTTFLREITAYSHLASLDKIRRVLQLGTLLPTPKDGIVTPFSFPVKNYNLTGFLAEADNKEDGKRQLKGEWVTNKRLWNKMQAGFVRGDDSNSRDQVVYFIHGGAFYCMSPATHRLLTISISRYCEARVYAIDYRLAPDTRFPGQLHDAVAGYMRLTLDLKIPPENIIFAGDSAGGGLCLATLMYLRDEGYPLPSAAILMSPWVDLTMSCESWETNRPFDYLPSPAAHDFLNPVKCLLSPEDIHKYLTHPYVSPLFGDFAGLPPLLIQAGDAEVLRDEITLLAHKASLAGVAVEHELFEDQVHVFQAFLFLPASRQAFQSHRKFVRHTLPRLARSKPSRKVDFGRADREIAGDAHVVDEQGNAAQDSLESSPRHDQLELGHVEADDKITEDVEHDQDRDRDQDGDGDGHGSSSSDGELSTDSDTTPIASPNSVPPSARPLEVAPQSPSLVRSASRPILRAYASARDLVMSPAKPAPAPTSAASFLNHARSASSPSSPVTAKRRLRSSTVSFSPRPIHCRSTSHPDLQDLLKSYTESGPGHETTLWSPADEKAAFGGVGEGEPNGGLGMGLGRPPAFAAESPGFGFA